MKTRASRLAAAASTLGVLSAIGCGGVTIKPESPNAQVPRANASSGLRAALSSESSTVDGDFLVWSPHFAETARTTVAPSVPAKLAEAVRLSGAFDAVDSSPADAAIDVLLSARSALKFTPDPSWSPKAVATGLTLFLASPFIIYGDRYDASVDLTVKDSLEREIARYAETYRVDMTHWMILPGQADDMLRGGADAAIAGLSAKLAADLVRDLDRIKLKARATGPRRVRPAQNPVAPTPVTPEPVSSAVPPAPVPAAAAPPAPAATEAAAPVAPSAPSEPSEPDISRAAAGRELLP